MKLHKEGDLGMLSMADRLAYIRSLTSKFNLKEYIQNSCGIKFYVYCLNSVCNHILSWKEESDRVVMSTEFRVIIVNAKEQIYATKYKTEYSIRNIERRLSNYTKQAKEFMVKMKKQEIENDFKRT